MLGVLFSVPRTRVAAPATAVERTGIVLEVVGAGVRAAGSVWIGYRDRGDTKGDREATGGIVDAVGSDRDPVDVPSTNTPFPLCAIVLARIGEPPIWSFEPATTSMPLFWTGPAMACPLTSVPMKLPAMRLPAPQLKLTTIP